MKEMKIISHVQDVILDQFLVNANDPGLYLPFTEAVQNLSEEEALKKNLSSLN